MRYRLVLFDLDGTLLDFRKGLTYALERAFRDLDVPYDPDHDPVVYGRINNQLWLEFEAGRIDRATLRYERFRLFAAERDLECDPDVLGDLYLRYLSETAFPLPGAMDLLEDLRGRCYMAIITNGFGPVQRSRIDRIFPPGMFDHVVISEEVGSRKPDPAIFLKVFSRFPGVGRNETVIVGDSPGSDILGGHQTGIDTCWFNPDCLNLPDGLRPTCSCETLKQVGEFLNGELVPRPSPDLSEKRDEK
jgi:2-haloacid dehalogenase